MIKILILVTISMLTAAMYMVAPNFLNERNEKEIAEIGTWRYTGSIENFSKRLENNVWGLTEEEKNTKRVKSYIFYKSNGNFGWEWDRPDPGHSHYVDPIAQGVTIGLVPYVNCCWSTDRHFPIMLKNISSLYANVEYRYTKLPTGSYNLAYGIWFIDESGKQIAEVMIWPYGGLDNPEQPLAYVSDGINEYSYYYRPRNPPSQRWEYHVFILRKQDPMILNYTVNMKKLFDWLIDSEKLDAELTIPSISLVNEVWKGSGRIEINKFTIDINGNRI